MDFDKIPILNVSLKRAVSNGQVYEVLTEEEYFKEASSFGEESELELINRAPIVAGDVELLSNSRSRSAKLRAVRKRV